VWPMTPVALFRAGAVLSVAPASSRCFHCINLLGYALSRRHRAAAAASRRFPVSAAWLPLSLWLVALAVSCAAPAAVHRAPRCLAIRHVVTSAIADASATTVAS
jgi:hypothetical protein